MNASLARWLYYAGQAWRGEPVARVLRELEASQSWPLERLKETQWARMAALARHAYDSVPYYQRRWSEAGFAPDALRSEADWRSLPVLEKSDLQVNRRELMSSSAPKGRAAATSGSSGTPAVVYRSHASWAHAHANVFRAWRWHGLEVGDRHAYFWGLPLQQAGRREARLRDWFFNRERLSAFAINRETARSYYEHLLRHPVRFGFGYPSAATQFADEITGLGLDGQALGLRAMITTAEVLHPHQRSRLAETFGCPIVDSYGCAEVGVAGFECEAGGMHIPIESVVVELIPSAPGVNEVLLTDLFNYSQPVVRYRVGDLAGDGPASCACGRQLPLLGPIQGRIADLIELPDGRVLSGELPSYMLKPHAKSGKVRQYQFARHPDGRIELRILPGPGWDGAVQSEIERDVSSGLGLAIRVCVVDGFERSARGKHRDFVRIGEDGTLL